MTKGRSLLIRLVLALAVVALAAMLARGIHAPETSAASHQAFDQFDADATGRHYTNAYLLSLMSFFVYDGEIDGATGDPFPEMLTEDQFAGKFEEAFTPLGLSNFSYIDIALTDTQAMVAETDDAVIVAFRGTEGLADIATDGAHLIFPPTLDGVHPGFAVAAASAQAEVTAAIKAAGDKEVWLTGHSLGGALAQVTAYSYAAANAVIPDSAPEVQGVVTFGSPRVFRTVGIAGPFYGATYGESRSQRWVNDRDPVPHAVLAPDWFHQSLWTLITVDDAGECSVLSLIAHVVLLPDLDHHEMDRYATRIFSLMDAADRIGLPLPPLPSSELADCDQEANVPPTAPSDANVSPNTVPEGAANGTAVGITASSTDANGDALTYSLTNDAGGRFAINSSTGVVTVANGALLDFETATSHSITVQADDGTEPGPDGNDTSASVTTIFTVFVTNVAPSTPVDTNAAPNEVAEGAANGTAVGVTAFSTDPNGPPVVYSLTDDAGSRFAINAATGVVTVANGALLDFESATSHDITAWASDGTAFSTPTTFTVFVTNVAPSTPIDSNAAANEVAEGAANGTAVGVTAFSTDPNGPAVAYSLTDDAGGRFAINAATGVVTVADGSSLDGPAAHDIDMVASDGVAMSDTATATVNVNNVDPAAVVDALGGGLASIGLIGVPVTFAGSFSDPAVLDTHTATIDWGDGSAVEDFGGAEVTSPVEASHTYGVAGDHTVSFTVTDDDGGSDTITASITVYDGAAAAGSVVDAIDELLASESDPAVLAALQAARDALDGNDGGADDNGAIDKLQTEDLVAALVKIQQAIGFLAEAEEAGGTDASDLKLLLALAGQSVAQDAYDDAVLALGPDPSRGKQKQLDRIAATIAAGIADVAADEYAAAVEDFLSAVQSAVDLTG